jgi:hypothetical protein
VKIKIIQNPNDGGRLLCLMENQYPPPANSRPRRVAASHDMSRRAGILKRRDNFPENVENAGRRTPYFSRKPRLIASA